MAGINVKGALFTMFQPVYFRLLSVLVICLICQPAAARLIASSGPLSAHVNDDFRCLPFVDVTVEAPSIRFFSNENAEFQGLVGSARTVLKSGCGSIKGMKIFGKVNKTRVYEGHSNEREGWRVVNERPETETYHAPGRTSGSRPPQRVGILTKAWEANDILRKEYGGFHINLVKNTGRDAGEKAFNLGVLSPERGGARLTVGFGRPSFSSCAELMSVEVSAFPAFFDFDKFRETHRGEDLPAKIIDAVYVTRDVLLEQCGQLKVLRFSFTSKAPGYKDLDYTGTLSQDSGWRIQDGVVATNYDNSRKVRLDMRDPYNPVGIDYAGVCETRAVLPLAPRYYSKAQESFAAPVKLTDYISSAERAARAYKKECPAVETISFSLTPMPGGYMCRANDPCYLTWSARKPSHIATDQITDKPEAPRLADYNDVIRAFAGGDTKLLDENVGFVRLFHNDFIESYSNKCRRCIKNPQARDIKTIETRYDQDGFKESEREVGPTLRVYIEPKYADRLDAFYGPNQAWGTMYLTKLVMGQMSGRRGSDAMRRGVAHFINNMKQIDAFLAGRCTDKAVQTLYGNLDRYYRREPLVKIDEKQLRLSGQ
jgi:hypothetical protein